ncbi:MAG: 4a-hydroxytetrahydrobiopterin dehydratase [Bacteroidota bacterium]
MWTEEDNKLKKTFKFEDFISAFSFMAKVAIVAEKQNHHPNWSNVYNTVSFELNTHDAGDIVTEKDHLLAAEIDKLA